ncbi:MAG: hypothetical protein GNW80_14070 [Asgard group archaeon]|nr:hypothetical protein [Asgard group archaeon]
MSELSVETQKWIIRLVEKQKKVELSFISAAIDVPKEDLITNAEKMGLMIEDESLVLSPHSVPPTFTSPGSLVLREMTGETVFCPKCGADNIFKLSKDGQKLMYFCRRCSTVLNNFWNGYTNGQYSLARCTTCQQPSFSSLKYCISCGVTIERETRVKQVKKSGAYVTDVVGDLFAPSYCTGDRYSSRNRIRQELEGRDKERKTFYASLIIGIVLGVLGAIFFFVSLSIGWHSSGGLFDTICFLSWIFFGLSTFFMCCIPPIAFIIAVRKNIRR